MIKSNAAGFFGKLPAHGDFVHRNLPANFVNIWDEWLQGFVGGTQEQLGEDWLDIYLTSPVWRFFFSAGVVDEYQWAGIVLPSVDRVGRYFPFSFVTKIQMKANPIDFVSLQKNWYDSVEDICLAALDGQIIIDDLVDKVNSFELKEASIYCPTTSLKGDSGMVVEMDFEEESPSAVIPSMLDAFISNTLSSYSVWTTRGSERINPCAFVTQGLPSIGGVAAMIDGQWDQWNWQQPYKLKNTGISKN
jgi:type VI secretion system protein ImpM